MASFKQKALRFLYPTLRKIAKSGKNGTVLNNEQKATPKESFYAQQVTLNNGQNLNFSTFSGKKILIVNTASNCGYTGQYAELQSLHQKLGDKLTIVAFPSNDFKEQEKADDKEIASFCQLNYGVTFPLAEKGVVLKTTEQQPVFQWLTNSEANGWCDHVPDWNFGKYIINEKGLLTHYFGPSVSPLEKVFLESVEK